MPTYTQKMESPKQRLKSKLQSQGSDSSGSDIFNELVLVLVFGSIKWDIDTVCQTASSSRKLHAIAKRVLWRELCAYRAPRMVAALGGRGGSHNRIGGGWQALAKLLFYCCGCESTEHFPIDSQIPGHFVKASRFSKTSGRSFLTKKCRGDLLYVSDPCEHPRANDKVDDLGVYRGVFPGFMKSRTRACLVARQVALEERARCPYCGARVWSMTSARLVPKSAAKRLGSHEDRLEFFVCVNGHLFGTCWLVPLSSDEEETDGGDEKEDSSMDGEDDDDDDDEYDSGGPSACNGTNGFVSNGGMLCNGNGPVA